MSWPKSLFHQISAGLFSAKWSFGMLPRCSMCIHVLQCFNSLLLRHPSNEALQWETQELLDVSAVWGCQASAFLSFTTCHETKQTCTSLSAPRFGQMITQEIASSTVVWQLFVLFWFELQKQYLWVGPCVWSGFSVALHPYSRRANSWTKTRFWHVCSHVCDGVDFGICGVACKASFW